MTVAVPRYESRTGLSPEFATLVSEVAWQRGVYTRGIYIELRYIFSLFCTFKELQGCNYVPITDVTMDTPYRVPVLLSPDPTVPYSSYMDLSCTTVPYSS